MGVCAAQILASDMKAVMETLDHAVKQCDLLLVAITTYVHTGLLIFTMCYVIPAWRIHVRQYRIKADMQAR